MADPIITKIGNVSAYLDAVAHGFEGTRAEFGELLANSANHAQSAANSASSASASATTATTKAMEATTAATAAQTAKTQTEAAASQALTDIGTAESGAISTVQTEGATQTANATAQAQAAATSATTASTKASEASASATSAGQSATNAAASATSAAQSASDAQDVLDSIPADYSEMSADVDQLKANLGAICSGGGLNLYNKDTNIPNTALTSNGAETASNIYDTSDYIFLPKGTYTVRAFSYNGTNPLYGIYLYETTKEFYTRYTPAISNYPNGYTFTVNIDRYVRFVIPNSNNPTEHLENVVLVSGDTSTQYEPYYTAYDMVARKFLPQTEQMIDMMYKEKSFSFSTIDGYYINASSGALQATQSAYSYTSPISVSSGDIVRVPKLANAPLVSNVAKVISDGVKYMSLITAADMDDFGTFYVVNEDCEIAFSTNTTRLAEFKIFESVYSTQIMKAINSTTSKAEVNTLVPNALKGSVVYVGDTKSSNGYICNAIAYDNGVIIACRSNGKVVRIGYDGTEETLLTINGSLFDWRCLWMDSNENVYASPHASWGSMNVADRGLYRLAKGENSMTKVISLYNTSSSIATETQNNNDTIWTMCEDNDGNLYAGVYAHTVRANPAIYKSTDGGLTWTYLINFNTAGLTTGDRHIHAVIYNEWQKALYCIVGEINTVFKSTDGGDTWKDLHVTLESKGSSMCATPYGIFIGSDNAYNCDIDVLYNDDVTHERVFRGWANTVFAIRCSDTTGFLYAFTKIDSSVNSTSYYPPVGALTDVAVIDSWRAEVGDTIYNKWKAYHDSIVGEYPEDSVRPQHYGIIVSTDGGKNWKPLIRFNSSSESANGLWTTGFFKNGECVSGRMEDHTSIKPVVISEGKHKYVSDGCDLSGEIFIRMNALSTVEPI